MQDQILDMLLKKDEITWQSLLYELVRTEQMNPWDIDISILSKKYLETVRKLQEVNFFISGKVILASAILLKIKSDKLLTENIAQFDNQLFQREQLEPSEAMEEVSSEIIHPKLTIKTPIARRRKVTINDLINALEKAMKVDERRTVKRRLLTEVPANIKIPERVDIKERIKGIYSKIRNFFTTKKEVLTFDKLVESDKREDKIFTFVPLLHLDNQQKINLLQEDHFGEIRIELTNKIS